MGTKVVVGLSGGVDSAVAAALLVRQGYEVLGVTLKVWESDDERQAKTQKWQDRSCCKIGLARFAAQQLGIPHCLIDAQHEFRRAVINDFVDGYLHGRTPNPCVRCNERIKFSQLYHAAVDLSADYIATGHYARVTRGHEEGSWQLRRSLDSTKDQTYFLYRLKKEWLPSLLFPLGDLRKSEVWTIAESIGLPVDEISESQEICFVTQSNYREFLAKEAPETDRPGDMVDSRGVVVGQHRGLAHYTPGQRRGLGLSSGERMYVLQLNPQTNHVVVGSEEKLLRRECVVGDLNLLCDEAVLLQAPIKGKIRYATEAAPARIEPHSETTLRLVFDHPQRAITPGQSAVFYRDDRVLGGGIIFAQGGDI